MPWLGTLDLKPVVTWRAIDRYFDTTTAAMLLRDVALGRGDPRGPRSLGVLVLLHTLSSLCVRGSHRRCANRVANPMPSRAGAPLHSPALHTIRMGCAWAARHAAMA